MSFDYLEFAELTDVGKKRQTNEDAVLCLPEAGVFGVADGMGGAECGALASQSTVDALREAFAAPRDELKAARIRDAINQASAGIKAQAAERGVTGMGSTVVVLYFDDERPGWAGILHAGDSRAYRFRNGVLECLTTDHTEAASADVENAGASPSMFRAVVTRAVGLDDVVDLEETPIEAEAGDVYLLCSDGLSKMVSDASLSDIFLQAGDVDCTELAHRMIDAANAVGGEDNVTALVVRVAETLPLPIPDVLVEQGDLFESGTHTWAASTEDSNGPLAHDPEDLLPEVWDDEDVAPENEGEALPPETPAVAPSEEDVVEMAPNAEADAPPEEPVAPMSPPPDEPEPDPERPETVPLEVRTEETPPEEPQPEEAQAEEAPPEQLPPEEPQPEEALSEQPQPEQTEPAEPQQEEAPPEERPLTAPPVAGARRWLPATGVVIAVALLVAVLARKHQMTELGVAIPTEEPILEFVPDDAAPPARELSVRDMQEAPRETVAVAAPVVAGEAIVTPMPVDVGALRRDLEAGIAVALREGTWGAVAAMLTAAGDGEAAVVRDVEGIDNVRIWIAEWMKVDSDAAYAERNLKKYESVVTGLLRLMDLEHVGNAVDMTVRDGESVADRYCRLLGAHRRRVLDSTEKYLARIGTETAILGAHPADTLAALDAYTGQSTGGRAYAEFELNVRLLEKWIAKEHAKAVPLMGLMRGPFDIVPRLATLRENLWMGVLDAFDRGASAAMIAQLSPDERRRDAHTRALVWPLLEKRRAGARDQLGWLTDADLTALKQALGDVVALMSSRPQA